MSSGASHHHGSLAPDYGSDRYDDSEKTSLKITATYRSGNEKMINRSEHEKTTAYSLTHKPHVAFESALAALHNSSANKLPEIRVAIKFLHLFVASLGAKHTGEGGCNCRLTAESLDFSDLFLGVVSDGRVAYIAPSFAVLGRLDSKLHSTQPHPDEGEPSEVERGCDGLHNIPQWAPPNKGGEWHEGRARVGSGLGSGPGLTVNFPSAHKSIQKVFESGGDAEMRPPAATHGTQKAPRSEGIGSEFKVARRWESRRMRMEASAADGRPRGRLRDLKHRGALEADSRRRDTNGSRGSAHERSKERPGWRKQQNNEKEWKPKAR
ncbi:hypothetical protein FB451DRAFT_1188475 [Mycena latifolia]|nr:hypothetical protein FB451DRAFT_1188475 [Mycena latifolia]